MSSPIISRRSILIGSTSLLLAKTAHSRRAVPDDNLLYPVLITVTSQMGQQGFGSGFYLNKDNAIYLVTAKHVLYPPSPNIQSPFVPMALNCMSYSNSLAAEDRVFINTTYANLNAQGLIKPSPSRDVAIVKLARVGAPLLVTPPQTSPLPTPAPTGQAVTPPPPSPTAQIAPPNPNNAMTAPAPVALSFFEGIVVTSTKPSNIRSASMDTVKRYSEVLVGNDAIMYGYPRSLSLDVSAGQLDPLQPLLRRGLIAGVNSQKQTIILDSAAYRGNSGGPVVELEQDNFVIRIKVIGVVSEFVPLREGSEDFFLQFNSGYSIIEPMDAILDLAQ